MGIVIDSVRDKDDAAGSIFIDARAGIAYRGGNKEGCRETDSGRIRIRDNMLSLIGQILLYVIFFYFSYGFFKNYRGR